jgi:AraC-like DNA-binding protein
MMDSIEKAVERAITTMRTNFADDVTIDDLARAAMFSKFHFTRVFRRTTGVSPGRFLSAVRLQEAKRLLVSTSLSIAEVSREVGYHSVGTFSTRFARSVGLSPTAYRQLGGLSQFPPAPGVADEEAGCVEGRIWASGDRPGLIYAGLFPGRIPEGPPIRCAMLDRPGGFLLQRVPVGEYYLLCQSRDPSGSGGEPGPSGERRLAVGKSGPITVVAGQVTRAGDVFLKPIRPMDPPILLALALR